MSWPKVGVDQMVVNSVSVIVPHYNRPDLVKAALLSIREQTVQPAEVLLVDDHSNAENLEKIKQLSGLATIITTPQNMGLASTRNFGAQHAQGEWIAFLDDDDTYLPNKLERQIQYLESHPQVKALGGALTMITPEGHQEFWGHKATGQLNLAHALCYTASMAQSLLIRRDVFLELGGFKPGLRHLEDLEFGIRLLASGYETHYLDEPLFLYHHGGSRPQLTSQWSKMFRAELGILNMHADLVRKEFGPRGMARLRARCCKKHGLWKGGFVGRSVWAVGCITEAVLGAHVDHPPVSVPV
jgi:GT2 family glycosyltransferase